MTITSFYFICFIAIVIILYYVIPQRFQWVFLLAISTLFYFMAGTPYTIIYLYVSTITIYLGSNLVHKYTVMGQNCSQNEDAEFYTKIVKKTKLIFILTLLIHISFLVVLKYTNFFIENINLLCTIFGDKVNVNTVEFISSLGISYYTLQLLSYLIDVYWGKIVPEKNFLKFTLFACYFPQMVSGPISRYTDINKDLYAKHTFNEKQVTFGIERIAWGFFKKLVISERLAVVVNTIFADVNTYYGCYLWIGMFAFALQLYTDFSGCMDIVLGVSECFGVTLPENFKTPFFSKNIQEFWQRWHITLGTWLKDYIMYPILKSEAWISMGDFFKKKLGKKWGKKIPVYCGMLILWLAMGMWHGSGWKFIVGEGIFFWLVIVLGQIISPAFDKIVTRFKIKTDCFSFHLFQNLRTFFIFSIGMVFFRADSFRSSIWLLRNSLKINNFSIFFDNSLLNLGLSSLQCIILFISLIVLLLVSLVKQKMDIRELLLQQNLIFRWAIWYALIFANIYLGMYGQSHGTINFIYQGF